MVGAVLILDLITIVLILREDNDVKKLRGIVEVKKLRLNERAIDMQMENTQGYINSMIETQTQAPVEPEEPQDEERNPIGFAQSKLE